MTAEHDTYSAAAAAYALDALDPNERGPFEAHLSTCPVCQRDVAEFRRVTAGLAVAMSQTDGAIEKSAPPPALKTRVLAAAVAETQRAAVAGGTVQPLRQAAAPSAADQPFAWWLTAAAAFAAIIAGGYAWSLHRQLSDVRAVATEASDQAQKARADLAAARQASARLAQSMTVMSAPDMMKFDLAGQATASAATGRAFVSRSRGLIFTASNLPPLPSGRVYQLWVIAPTPVSVGMLNMTADGTATLSTTLKGDMPAIAAVAVTNEPGPTGSATPSTPILMMGTGR